MVTNVGYAHVEFFDSIEGVAAAKRELIEALPPRWRRGAQCRRSARARASARSTPAARVTFGFSEGADVRAEAWEVAPDGTRFRALGVDFETAHGGPPRRDEPAGGASPWRAYSASRRSGCATRCARFTAGKMRGERTGAQRHRGLERLL